MPSAALVERGVAYGLERTQAALRAEGIGAALLFDAYNIRYVTGTSVMQVWTLHAMDRYVLVPATGRPILWEYPAATTNRPESAAYSVRTAKSWSVFDVGVHSRTRAAAVAAEVVALLAELDLGDTPLAVDRLDTYGFLALQEAGLSIRPAQLLMESARSVKSVDEVELIRRSVAVADRAVCHLLERLQPGRTEHQVWADFTGPAFADGAEYVECRLLSSGPRTNPWFQEATDRRIEPGDLVSFDTDLIGPAGYLADVSRAYLVGDRPPTSRQRRLYHDAEAFLAEIAGELRVGAAFDEVGERLSARFPQKYHAQRYPFIAHSSGLCDEYPTILFDHHHQGQIEAGMLFCIEAYVGEEGDDEGLKLEEQVLVTDDGVELLSQAPHDDRLSSR